ncbi:MAG: LytTR family transcriptional regulator [Bacteroidaceae bacterium]|nr:LytTR family transcriptional regulator [Bacteroidaceae bacterium]
MEWFKVYSSTELLRVATTEIVYVKADGNYSEIVLINNRKHRITMQLHVFEGYFRQLRHNFFVRVGRSLIVNKRFIYLINLPEQKLVFAGPYLLKDISTALAQERTKRFEDIYTLTVSREALKELKQTLETEKGGDYE